MGKIRHIAYRAADVEAFVKFFVEGLGLTVARRRTGGIVDLSDGTINIVVIPEGLVGEEGEPLLGLSHIGLTVEDEDKTLSLLQAAGGEKIADSKSGSGNYETKTRGPEGIIVDLGHWVGAEPIMTAEADSQPS
jgi:catechol 2,3-dioxygenase-like lactoylglutathione lyase family enzyme